MTDYTGALKDVSALELGAIAARGRVRRRPASSRSGSITPSFGNVLQTSSDAIYGARHVALKAGVPHGSAGADRQPAVRVGHPGRRQRRADDPARRSRHRAHRRHREHEPGAARDSRAAVRPQAEPGQARGLPLRGAARSVLRPVHGADGGEVRGRSTTFRATSRTPTRCAASRRRRRPGPTGKFKDEVVPVELKTRAGRDGRRPRRPPAARHDARGPGQAAGGVFEGRHGHGRQRQRHRRWRRGADSGVRRRRERQAV